VYDAHELYTGFDDDPPRLWLRTISALEGALARSADSVVTVSEQIADELVRRHRLARRPLVVLNCPPVEERPFAGHAGALRVIYQAAAGPGRHLLDLAPLADLPDIEVASRVLGGDVPPPGIEQLAPVGQEDLVAALEPFDIGLVIDRTTTDNTRLALPNKLFEYLMAGLAVVVPDAPAMAALVEREGVGKVYGPGCLDEVVRQLARDRRQTEELRHRARDAALERYNAEAQRPVLYAAWGL
jgi:glycosyltransferase involved in cell wall biosynthesis